MRDNLFTGLGIPKSFLGYQSSAGEGKNMAQADVRFAKKVNRIQQALVQELNKIAIIHLYLKGYDKEDCDEFTLRLSNPSTQQDLLKTDLWTQKANLYTVLTTTAEGGIAPMSHTNAKQFVFNWSEAEIADDLKKQMMERVVGQELVDASTRIRETGLFADITKRYGSGEAPSEGAISGTTTDIANDATTGGNALASFQNPNELPPVEGEPMTSTVGGAAGAPAAPTGGAPAGGVAAESRYIRTGKLITEDRFNDFVDILTNGKSRSPVSPRKIVLENSIDVENTNKQLNTDAFMMIGEIDDLLKEGAIKINKHVPFASYVDPEPLRLNEDKEPENYSVDFDDIDLPSIDTESEV